MLSTISAAVRPTISHLWRQNHLSQLFSISSATSKSSWSKDLKTRRRQYDDKIARQKKKYAQNAEMREKALSRLRATRAAQSEADARRIRQRNSCYKWVVNGLKHGIVRSWKTHTPELFDKSNARLCSGCNVFLRKTLWWRRNDDYDSDSGGLYDCSSCFMEDWSRVHPIGHKPLTWTKPLSKSKHSSDATASDTSDMVGSLPESKP